jgi:hypothetical protein
LQRSSTRTLLMLRQAPQALHKTNRPNWDLSLISIPRSDRNKYLVRSSGSSLWWSRDEPGLTKWEISFLLLLKGVPIVQRLTWWRGTPLTIGHGVTCFISPQSSTPLCRPGEGNRFTKWSVFSYFPPILDPGYRNRGGADSSARRRNLRSPTRHFLVRETSLIITMWTAGRPRDDRIWVKRC